MATADQIKKLVSQATPSSPSLPPEERKPQEQVDAAKKKLQDTIAKHPQGVFLTMAENGIQGLKFFTIDQLKALGPEAVEIFTAALTDPKHPWYEYAYLVHIFAQVDNSQATLDAIMQRLTGDISERYAQRFYPMAGYALKLFEPTPLAEGLTEVVKNTSWFNRYVIAMILRNASRGYSGKNNLAHVMFLLLEMVDEADPASPDAHNITRLRQQVEIGLKEDFGI